MNAPTTCIRTALFVVALTLGLLNWGANPVSSQPQSEGGVQPYAIPASASSALPLSSFTAAERATKALQDYNSRVGE